jgi:hypothetical protein
VSFGPSGPLLGVKLETRMLAARTDGQLWRALQQLALAHWQSQAAACAMYCTAFTASPSSSTSSVPSLVAAVATAPGLASIEAPAAMEPPVHQRKTHRPNKLMQRRRQARSAVHYCDEFYAVTQDRIRQAAHLLPTTPVYACAEQLHCRGHTTLHAQE